ncbi:hypothetical protein Acor_64590 [Acrocarpospora corrugata]|uniref:Uncharacterized protein n=1 Tax=Acrocarpospora corrugata TaxID=35763 RepID=A0A5M3WBG4_9ACTN|nr:hypothetical protein Acor_64590 [Acrocarpospora corrugata]
MAYRTLHGIRVLGTLAVVRHAPQIYPCAVDAIKRVVMAVVRWVKSDLDRSNRTSPSAAREAIKRHPRAFLRSLVQAMGLAIAITAAFWLAGGADLVWRFIGVPIFLLAVSWRQRSTTSRS